MAKNKKGLDKKEYPKLIKVEGKKVLVNNEAEEAKYFPVKEAKAEKKAAAWGKDK